MWSSVDLHLVVFMDASHLHRWWSLWPSNALYLTFSWPILYLMVVLLVTSHLHRWWSFWPFNDLYLTFSWPIFNLKVFLMVRGHLHKWHFLDLWVTSTSPSVDPYLPYCVLNGHRSPVQVASYLSSDLYLTFRWPILYLIVALVVTGHLCKWHLSDLLVIVSWPLVDLYFTLLWP